MGAIPFIIASKNNMEKNLAKVVEDCYNENYKTINKEIEEYTSTHIYTQIERHSMFIN